MKKFISIFILSLVIFSGCSIKSNTATMNTAAGAENDANNDEENLNNNDNYPEYVDYISESAKNADFDSDFLAANPEEDFYSTVEHANYSDIMKKDEARVYYFYQPNCGYCNRAKPMMIKFQEEVAAQNDLELYFVDISDDEDAWAASDYVTPKVDKQYKLDDIKIQGTPTMIYLEGDTLLGYSVGGTQIDELINFLEEQYNLA